MKCANCYDTVAAMLAAKDKAIAEITADRDEWKQQHELLLGVRNADLAAKGAKLTSQVASGEAVAWVTPETADYFGNAQDSSTGVFRYGQYEYANIPLYLHPPTPSQDVLVEALRSAIKKHLEAYAYVVDVEKDYREYGIGGGTYTSDAMADANKMLVDSIEALATYSAPSTDKDESSNATS